MMKIFYADKTVYIDQPLKSHKIDFDRELTEQEVQDVLQSPILSIIIEKLTKE